MVSVYHRFLALFLGFLIFLVVGVSGFNYVVDPIEYFRFPTWRKPIYFPGYERYQDVGIAAHHAYNTVVIGNSLTENFLSLHIDAAWNATKTIKLSISGSTAD